MFRPKVVREQGEFLFATPHVRAGDRQCVLLWCNIIF
jgi:hypothetical protein